MKHRTFILLMTFMTPIDAVILGLLTDNSNWPWNIPLGLAFGYAGGVLLWPLVQRVQSRRDKRDAEVKP